MKVATIDKPEAAERMIVAAIGMSDRGDDPLAIHVVASSALSLLRELIEKGGDNYIEQVLKLGLFHAASARLKGGAINLPTNPQIDRLIEKVMGGLEDGEIKQASDLTITLDKEELRKLLDYITRPFNFLKHAQRDPLATLDEGDVEPEGTIVHALAAFSMICPGNALPDQIAPFAATAMAGPASVLEPSVDELRQAAGQLAPCALSAMQVAFVSPSNPRL